MAFPYEKTAIVTGAASGIGRALAVEWGRRRFKVGVLDLDMDEARNTVDMVSSAGGVAKAFRCDVGRLEDVQAAADYFYDAWGRVGLLVNNAGVMAAGCMGEITIEEWRRVIDVDLWGVVHGCHVFVPKMKAAGGGHILNVASMAGITPPIEEAPYVAAKAGVIGLSESLKIELAPFDIGVSVLCPMGVNTRVLEHSTEVGDFIIPMWEVAMKNTSLSPSQIAAKVAGAVEKNKFYLIPHTTGKFFWLNKRMMPSTFLSLMAFMNRRGLARPFLMLLARRGWL